MGKKGPEFTIVTDSTMLKIGDKITIRIEISTQQDLDYVCINDVRAACIEPINTYSGYVAIGRFGYYQLTDANSTNFYIHFLSSPKLL